MAVIDVQGVEVEQDIVFGRGGDRQLRCDVYRPAPAVSKRTAVIHLHGGGFRAGSKAGARLARPLAALGYTCLSASYRLAQEAVWPAQIQDVKACIRWARANAGTLGVDTDKVVVLGYSAGGRLALIASGTPNDPGLEGDGGAPGVDTRVAACVAFYAPVETLSSPGTSHPVLGPEPDAESVRSFSPLAHVGPGYAPTLLLHGTADQTVGVGASLTMFTALRAAGVPVELHAIEGVGHIFDLHADFARASAQWIDLFLDRHVVNPRVYPSTEPGR
jgi:acetyl esterase/lipase